MYLFYWLWKFFISVMHDPEAFILVQNDRLSALMINNHWLDY